jgi:hypothetical protein
MIKYLFENREWLKRVKLTIFGSTGISQYQNSSEVKKIRNEIFINHKGKLVLRIMVMSITFGNSESFKAVFHVLHIDSLRNVCFGALFDNLIHYACRDLEDFLSYFELFPHSFEGFS